MDISVSELQSVLKKVLPKKRFQHTVGVRYMCAALAMKYGFDIKKAELAGLLHDCAKYMKSGEILQKCQELDLGISIFEMDQPQLLHGKLGAFYAENQYGITEQDILDAIQFHTTGRPGMSLLEKILFIADYIEPGRDDIEDLDIIRKSAFEDIDRTILLKIESVLQYLQDTAQTIDNLTLETYEFYKNK